MPHASTFSALTLCTALVLPGLATAGAASGSEIGDYLRSRLNREHPGYGVPTGLRTDTLDETSPYASPLSAHVEPWYGPLETPVARWLRWLPPIPIPEFRHDDPDDPDRHIGLGWPLEGTSWRNRPFHAGWLVGGLYADNISATLRQDDDVFGGYRVGWDFDHYWGVEGRWGFSRPDLTSSGAAIGNSRDWFFDTQLLYYPWGDARWRPFVAGGFGFADIRFRNNGVGVKTQAFTMPIGFGVKYYWKKWLAVRGEVMDNIVFATGDVDTMHSASVTFGVEVRTGPARRSYSSW
ncbi:MAG: outer membrane beta-barrel protein [Pirellulaceae bacterium]|jgi:hypothetical protein|nr:outer membrane beta-barrel protein [Pirellulaceae bacterium]MDP7019047.1 outer membrane beta-barrel protein [Pirellulaceae bacterium]